jgi:hypothetical protein
MAKTRYLRSDDMKIVLTDSLVTAILVGLFLDATHVIPTVFCFIIAALAAIGMAVLFFTKIGFWIVAVIYSLFWGVFWALIAGALSGDNAILEWSVGIIACACSVFLHWMARRYHRIVTGQKTE